MLNNLRSFFFHRSKVTYSLLRVELISVLGANFMSVVYYYITCNLIYLFIVKSRKVFLFSHSPLVCYWFVETKIRREKNRSKKMSELIALSYIPPSTYLKLHEKNKQTTAQRIFLVQIRILCWLKQCSLFAINSFVSFVVIEMLFQKISIW